MKITITTRRAVVGNDIQVEIEAAKDERIAIVRVVLDDLELWNDEASSDCVNWQNLFSSVGDAAPSMDHVAVVTVTDRSGQIESAQRIWKDP